MHEGVHLFVRDLRLAACVGTSEQEREEPQQLVAQLNLITDTIAACHSDVLADTVDYAALTHHLAQEAGKKQTRLLEALAERLVQACFQFDQRIVAVSLRLEKPQALPQAAAAAGVFVHRENQPPAGVCLSRRRVLEQGDRRKVSKNFLGQEQSRLRRPRERETTTC
ncbi:MAG: dihydroneopterin aldolase [Myxococcota bacterium]